MNSNTHTQENFSAFDSDAFRKRAEEEHNPILLDAFKRIQSADLSHPTREMIMDACQTGNLKAAETLLKNGADVHARDAYGETTLHLAAQSGNLELVQHLIECGADIQATDLVAQPVIHFAARSRNLQLLKWLVTNGANINAKDSHDELPWQYGAEFGWRQVVDYFAACGGDVTNALAILETSAQPTEPLRLCP